MDFSALSGGYRASGRKAFHPRTLLGLIVYGILIRGSGRCASWKGWRGADGR
jgi:uncharacterized membrane protein YedE/YeeE